MTVKTITYSFIPSEAPMILRNVAALVETTKLGELLDSNVEADVVDETGETVKYRINLTVEDGEIAVIDAIEAAEMAAAVRTK